MVEPSEAGALVFHPGEFIADELQARNQTPVILICKGWDEDKILRLLQGEERIDYVLASHIRTLWGIDTEFWFRLQVTWDTYPDRRENPPWPREFSKKG